MTSPVDRRGMIRANETTVASLVVLSLLLSLFCPDAPAGDYVIARTLYPQATPEPWEQDTWLCHLADSTGGDLDAGFVKAYQFSILAVHTVMMPGRHDSGTPASRDSLQDLYLDDRFVVQGACFTVSVAEPKYEVIINGTSHGEWHYCMIYINRSYPSGGDYRQVIVIYSNGFIRTKGLGDSLQGGSGDFRFGTSAVLGPYFCAPQGQAPDDLVHPWIDTVSVTIEPCISFALALSGGLSDGTSTPISVGWRIGLNSVDDYHSEWSVLQRIEAVEPVPLTEFGLIGKVLCLGGMSSMWYSSSVFDSNILRVLDVSGQVVDSLYASDLQPPDDPYTESEPMLIPAGGGVEMAKTHDDTHNSSSPDIQIFGIEEVEWTVGAEVTGGILTLEWAPVPIADSIFVFRETAPFFVPDHVGYSNRVASLAGSATEYASSYGVGNPSLNAFHRLCAYSIIDGTLGFSGALGETDFGLSSVSSDVAKTIRSDKATQ